jgi:hypothetical protein
MNIKTILLTTCLLIIVSTNAQNFAGYNSANNIGVNSVFFNPASICDSRYKWNFNLATVNGTVTTNYASVKSSDMLKMFSGDTISGYFTRDPKVEKVQLASNIDILGPSLMLSLNPKSSFAITTRVRNLVSFNGSNGNFLNLLENKNQLTTSPFLQPPNSFSYTTHSWAEIGLSYARVIFNGNVSFLKGGVSVKYLGGLGAGYVNASNIRGTVEKKTQLEANMKSGSGNLNFAHTGVTNIDLATMNGFIGTGLGFDIGLVYELRANLDKYKLNYDEVRRDKNKYTLRLGIALKDIGSINFNKNPASGGNYLFATNSNPNGKDTINLNRFNGIKSLSELETVINGANPIIKKNKASDELIFKLPSTLTVDADLNIGAGFFVNATASFTLNNDETDIQRTNYYNYVVITPRFEAKGFGIYVPFSNNPINGLNSGLCLNLGSLYIGSSNIISSYLKGETQQFNVQAGFKFGLFHGKSTINKSKKSSDSEF